LTAPGCGLTGASSGIGEALVAALVRRGARVAVTARRTELLTAIAAKHAGGRAPVLVVPADVTDAAAVTAAAQTWSRRGAASISRSSMRAGRSARRSRLATHDLSPPSTRRPMALNFFSVVYGIDAVLPGMLERGHGRIAAVASLGGFRPTTVGLPYTASKAAVIHLMEGLRMQVAWRGVAGHRGEPRVRANAADGAPLVQDAISGRSGRRRGSDRARAGTRKDEIVFPAPLAWTIKLMGLLPNRLYARIMRELAPK
jgi:NADP-dependent 3-hydroxy acid dehydrogenase YdfG